MEGERPVADTSARGQRGNHSHAGAFSPAGTAFGERLPCAERFAALLRGPGLERGLIGPREVDRLWERHLLNCAVIAELIPHRGKVVDIGSGAGLPGLVLAIARPDLDLVLVESRHRPTVFLDECIEELGMSSVTVRRARAEELPAGMGADVVTARAVAGLPRLAGWGRPLLHPGGLLLAMKGDTAERELADVRPDLDRLGFLHAEIVRVGEGVVDPLTTVVRLVAGTPGRRARRGRRR